MIARHSHKHLFDLQTFPFKLDSSLPKGSIFFFTYTGEGV